MGNGDALAIIHLMNRTFTRTYVFKSKSQKLYSSNDILSELEIGNYKGWWEKQKANFSIIKFNDHMTHVSQNISFNQFTKRNPHIHMANQKNYHLYNLVFVFVFLSHYVNARLCFFITPEYIFLF
jgi:hypothetical protein